MKVTIILRSSKNCKGNQIYNTFVKFKGLPLFDLSLKNNLFEFIDIQISVSLKVFSVGVDALILYFSFVLRIFKTYLSYCLASRAFSVWCHLCLQKRSFKLFFLNKKNCLNLTGNVPLTHYNLEPNLCFGFSCSNCNTHFATIWLINKLEGVKMNIILNTIVLRVLGLFKFFQYFCQFSKLMDALSKECC